MSLLLLLQQSVATNQGGDPAPLPHMGLLLQPTISTGSFALTGQSAAFRTTRYLSCSQASFTLSGQDSTLTLYSPGGSAGAPAPLPSLGMVLGGVTGYSLVGQTGAYVYTGQTATFSVAAGTGQGGDPAPLPHMGLLLASGSGVFELVCNYGDFALTGSDGIRDLEVTCAYGTFTFSGQSATLTAPGTQTYSLTCAQGSFALSGQAAGRVFGYVLACSHEPRTFWNLQDIRVLRTYVWPLTHATYVIRTEFPSTAQAVGGKSRKKRQQRRWFVEIGEQQFLVDSAEEARALLERARTLAPRAAQADIEKASQKAPEAPPAVTPPVVRSNVPDVQAQVKAVREAVQSVYAQAVMEAELRLLMQRQMRLEDEEDDETLLLV